MVVQRACSSSESNPPKQPSVTLDISRCVSLASPTSTTSPTARNSPFGAGSQSILDLMPTSPSPRAKGRKKHTSESEQRVMNTGRKTLYMAGRPPWYDVEGQTADAYVIGICGGSASGKTLIARSIVEALNVPWVSLLSMDTFYKVLSPEESERAHRSEYNFDHPDAFDLDLLRATLARLRSGKNVQVPIYNFSTHSREIHTKTIYGADVVIFEGIFAFCNAEIRSLLDLKIFVDTDGDIRLARRLARDIEERGRDLTGVLTQYNRFVKPAYDDFIEPARKYADVVIPRGGKNLVACDLVAQYISTQLKKKGGQTPFFNFENKLEEGDHGRPSNLYRLDSTAPSLKSLLTRLRDVKTKRDEFVFYAKRVMRTLIEYSLSLLPFENCTVSCPSGTDGNSVSFYDGKRIASTNICGVSILRAGETLEPALREVCKDVKLGKLLIQTNEVSRQPELYYLRLPSDIKKCHVLLLDAITASGDAAVMAIRVLLDHDVPEQNILLVTLLASTQGLHNVAYAYPKIKIICADEDSLDPETFHILPGLGNFGDRFFGTEENNCVFDIRNTTTMRS